MWILLEGPESESVFEENEEDCIILEGMEGGTTRVYDQTKNRKSRDFQLLLFVTQYFLPKKIRSSEILCYPLEMIMRSFVAIRCINELRREV